MDCEFASLWDQVTWTGEQGYLGYEWRSGGNSHELVLGIGKKNILLQLRAKMASVRGLLMETS